MIEISQKSCVQRCYGKAELQYCKNWTGNRLTHRGTQASEVNVTVLKLVSSQVTGDLSATTLAVLKSLGHFPNRGVMLLHNIHYKYMYICMSNLVYNPRMLILGLKLKSKQV